MLSIPPLAAATTFHVQAGRVYAADGRELVILDVDARTRIADALARDLASVFVVETGPLGFVRDYAIEPAQSQRADRSAASRRSWLVRAT